MPINDSWRAVLTYNLVSPDYAGHVVLRSRDSIICWQEAVKHKVALLLDSP